MLKIKTTVHVKTCEVRVTPVWQVRASKSVQRSIRPPSHHPWNFVSVGRNVTERMAQQRLQHGRICFEHLK